MCFVIKKASIEDGKDIFDMLQKMPKEENGFMNSVNGKSYSEYMEWLQKVTYSSHQTEIIDGWKVPETTYWLYENEIPVGYGKLRHFLTEKLLAEGGNIAYSIVPYARNRGLGKKFVSMLITEAKNISIEKLLFTIQNNNAPSIHTALSNGGNIERITDKRHYIWINL